MKKLLPLTLLLCAAPAAQAQSPLGSAFTYQGQLNDAGGPANGRYDVRFGLFNSSGVQVGSWLTNAATSLAGGYFNAELDFGPSVYNGNAYWLEIAVRTNGNGAFTTLTPRQKITPAPYAVYAATSGTAASASTATSAGVATTANNVVSGGVGTSALANGAVTGNKVAANTLTAANVDSSTFNRTFWKTSGNAGTLAATDFLGTSDSQPLELRVNGARALRLEMPVANQPNVIGGSGGNGANTGAVGSTISGGYNIRVANSFASIGGGGDNTNGGFGGTIGGGRFNSVTNDHTTVGGGYGNKATAMDATVAGGSVGTASAARASIGGGYQNQASNYAATVPGGEYNTAGGTFSLAAGRRAKALHNGSLVWGDATDADITSTADNQVTFRAGGGLRFIGGLTLDAPNATGELGKGLLFGSYSGEGIASLRSSTGSNPWGLDFFTGFTPRLSIANDGDVGVGTQSPQARLHVAGTVLAEGLRLGTNSNYAGAVLASDSAGNLSAQEGLRVLRTSTGGPYPAPASPNVIGGYSGNSVSNGVVGAAIGGGGAASLLVGYDLPNKVGGDYGTVPGGAGNLAAGAYSLGAGRRAKALHNGSFVWADSQNSDMASTGSDQFIVRAQGGVGLGIAPSDPDNILSLGRAGAEVGNFSRWGDGWLAGALTVDGRTGVGTRSPLETLHVAGTVRIEVGGTLIQVKSDGTVSIYSGGNMDIRAAKDLTLTGATIRLNATDVNINATGHVYSTSGTDTQISSGTDTRIITGGFLDLN